MAVLSKLERALASSWLSALCFGSILVTSDTPWFIAIPAICIFAKWDTALDRLCDKETG